MSNAESEKKTNNLHSLLVRHKENPLISPHENKWWESWQTFNPGALLLNNEVHMIYRAIGDDGISRFGYAKSKDGFHIDEISDDPVFEYGGGSSVFSPYSFASGGSYGGVEDPRLVRVGDEDVIYMTYTAFDHGLGVAITSIRIDDFLNQNWNWTEPQLISPPHEVHKNWVVFPEKIRGKYAILHSLTPKTSIAYVDTLNFLPGYYVPSYHNGGNGNGREKLWDSIIRGIGAPPLKTEKGWLLFYHAIDRNEPYKYKVGAVLTDLENPRDVIRCSSVPVLESSAVYEYEGFKPGVIYLTGAIEKDGTLMVYYGSSDSYVCAASCQLNEFLDALLADDRRVFNEERFIPFPKPEKQQPVRPTGKAPGLRKAGKK